MSRPTSLLTMVMPRETSRTARPIAGMVSRYAVVPKRSPKRQGNAPWAMMVGANGAMGAAAVARVEGDDAVVAVCASRTVVFADAAEGDVTGAGRARGA